MHAYMDRMQTLHKLMITSQQSGFVPIVCLKYAAGIWFAILLRKFFTNRSSVRKYIYTSKFLVSAVRFRINSSEAPLSYLKVTSYVNIYLQSSVGVYFTLQCHIFISISVKEHENAFKLSYACKSELHEQYFCFPINRYRLFHHNSLTVLL